MFVCVFVNQFTKDIYEQIIIESKIYIGINSQSHHLQPLEISRHAVSEDQLLILNNSAIQQEFTT